MAAWCLTSTRFAQQARYTVILYLLISSHAIQGVYDLVIHDIYCTFVKCYRQPQHWCIHGCWVLVKYRRRWQDPFVKPWRSFCETQYQFAAERAIFFLATWQIILTFTYFVIYIYTHICIHKINIYACIYICIYMGLLMDQAYWDCCRTEFRALFSERDNQLRW